MRMMAMAGCGVGLATMTGCLVPDSTNPILTVQRADVSDAGAELDLRVENRSAFDLTLTGVSWEVMYGPIPVGSGEWEGDPTLLVAATEGSTPLPPDETGSVVSFSRFAAFDFPPIDPDAGEIELFGEMRFDGEIETAPFRVTAPVGR